MHRGASSWRHTTVETVAGLFVLSGFWLVGEGVARLVPRSPLPGSLWGMVALFGVLAAGWLPERRVRRAASLLVRWLGLLFVPVGVGVVAYGELIRTHALAIGVSIIVGSVLTIVASAGAASWTARRRARASE